MSSTKDGGAAFPMSSGLLALINGALEASNLSDEEKKRAGDKLAMQAFGMSLRDYFAAVALEGLLAHVVGVRDGGPPQYAARAYQYADAMLKAREGGAA